METSAAMITLPDLPPEATDEGLRAFYAYWRGRAPEGRLPGRQHFDPIDIPQLMPHLVLLDVVPQPDDPGALRFRVRVAGATLVELVGCNPTGNYIDDYVIDARKPALNAAYASVARDRAAHYWEHNLWTPGRDYIRVQRLALPLARDGEQVDMVVACYARVPAPPPET